MDLDFTLVLQLGIFLVVLVALKQLLFQPFLKVLEARDQKLAGAKRDIERMGKEAQADLEVYQTRMREARDLAFKEREALVAAGRDEERRLLAEVRNDIAKALNDARKEVAAAELAAKESLTQETEALARRLVQKVLGREVAS